MGLLCSGHGQSQKRFQIPVNVHLDSISSTAEPFVTKHCLGQSIMQEDWCAVFKVQGHDGIFFADEDC